MTTTTIEPPCQQHPRFFYPSYDKNMVDYWPLGRKEAAKQICQDCGLRDRCLDRAISTRDEFGIWGGRDEGERRKIRLQWARTLPNLFRQIDPAVDDVAEVLLNEGSL